MSEKDDELQAWLETGKHLPEMMRDFHDQKDLFKAMHSIYEGDENDNQWDDNPNWRDGQIYTIDWFLWYMAGRGYTLQKNRKKLQFREFENWRNMEPKVGLAKPSMIADN